jgi:hypothetical protein
MRTLLIILSLALLSRAGGAQSPPAQSLWASVGLGGSAKGVATMASASYSRGPAVVIARRDFTGQFDGPDVNDKAILAGLRTGKDRRFALAAVGVARSRSTYRSGGGIATDQTRTALAFQLQGQPDFDVSPLGFTILGQAGPASTSYLGAVLTLDLGWFGVVR